MNYYNHIVIILYFVVAIESVNDPIVDTENDLMLAQMLQLQFDEEYEKVIKAQEYRMNGTSKGTQ